MTISSTSTSTAQASNGVVTDFVANFKILEDDHIIVYHVVGSTATLKALTTDYTVPTVGTSTTTVKFNSAPATGTVYMFLATAFTQLKRYVNSDKFPASSHEEALDKLTLLLQQTRDRTNRWALSQFQRSLSAAHINTDGLVSDVTGLSFAPVEAGRVYRIKVIGHGQIASSGYSYAVRLFSGAAGTTVGRYILTNNVGTTSSGLITAVDGSNPSGFEQSPTTSGVACSFDIEAIFRCTAAGNIGLRFATTSGSGLAAQLNIGTTLIVEELPGCSTIPALSP